MYFSLRSPHIMVVILVHQLVLLLQCVMGEGVEREMGQKIANHFPRLGNL